MTSIQIDAEPAGHEAAWETVKVGTKVDDATAREIGTWFAQARNGHAGTFTALASGQPVEAGDLLAAVDSEYEAATDEGRQALDALRGYVAKRRTG